MDAQSDRNRITSLARSDARLAVADLRGRRRDHCQAGSGGMLVFNNQRVMHGRTGFDPSRSHRHVRSRHVDLDEFHSRLRVAYRQRGGAEAWMAFGAGTRV